MLQRTVGAMVGQKSKMCSYRIPVQDPPDIAPNRWCLRALGGLAGAQLALGGRVGSVDNSNHPDHILISGVSRAALHESLGLLRLPTRPSQVKNANLKLLPRGICPKEASTVLEKAPWHHDTSSSRKCIARVRLQNRPVHSKVLSVNLV